MVYAYDQWAQLPVRDLYNTQVMAMAIQSAKDMYEKAENELKDFRKEYNDFLSPIQADMDWYDQNVTGKLRDTINQLYANGQDPLRSSEGRAKIRQVINNIDTGGITQRRQAAQNANEYIKNRDALIKAGMWNPDYERQQLGGQLLEEWDGSLGPWTATSASPYQDYERKYGHLFDKMGYEYDEEESKKHPGMNVMTKNKNRMRDILSASRPDLVNDPQYRYDLQRIQSQILRDNPDMSVQNARDLASRRLEDEIIERNYKGGMQMTEDPIARENRQFANQVKLANLNHAYRMAEIGARQSGNNGRGSRTRNGSTKDELGMKSGILNTGIAMVSGTSNPNLQGRRIKPNMRNIFNSGFQEAGLDIKGANGSFGLPIYNTTTREGGKVKATFSPKDSRWSVFRNYVTSKLTHYIEPKDFPEYIGHSAIKDEEQFGITQLSQNDIKNLSHIDDIITHSYGYSGGVVGSQNVRKYISDNMNNGVKYDIIPSDEALTTLNRSNGSLETYYKVRLRPDDEKYQSFNIYIKDDALTTSKNDISGTKPITNMDIDERNMDIARSRSITLDQKYKASINNNVDVPISGTWSGQYGDVNYPSEINDSWFYRNLNE